MGEKMVKNQLQADQKFKLANYILMHQKELSGRTRDAMAEMATKELGFKVMTANILGAEKMAGVKLERSRSSPGNAPHQTDRTRALASFTRDLYVQLGVPVPTALDQICAGKRYEV